MRLHLPQAYRYEVANPEWRAALNRYGWQIIGVGIVVGRYAYCLKWAWAR